MRDLIRRDMERRDGQFVQDAVLSGYRDLAAGRVFESSGSFKADMAALDRKEANGWQDVPFPVFAHTTEIQIGPQRVAM